MSSDTLREGNWIVTDGLADGDQIIVSGIMKAKPGQPAKATAWHPDADQGQPPQAAAPATAKH